MTTLDEVVAAPAEIGVALIGVREGSEIDLDLRFEAVHEGILVSGTATVEIDGECGRCEIPEGGEVDAGQRRSGKGSGESTDDGERGLQEHRDDGGDEQRATAAQVVGEEEEQGPPPTRSSPELVVLPPLQPDRSDDRADHDQDRRQVQDPGPVADVGRGEHQPRG